MSAPPGAYGQPVSAPTGAYGQPPAQPPYGTPVSAPPGAYGQPTVNWPAGPTPPQPSRTGRTVAIVLGVTVPLVLIVCVVAGLLIPRVLNNQAGPGSTAAPNPTEEGPVVPAVGDCWVAFLVPSPFYESAEEAERVSCDEEHMLETIAVGDLTDAASPPDEYSDEAREIYRGCEQTAQEFLGAPWRSTYTWLVLAVPSRAAWRDGARWYRCDLTVNRAYYQTRPARTTGSLRGNAEPITCLTWLATDASLMDIDPIDCNEAHEGELAGVYPVPSGADFSDTDALTRLFDDMCTDVVEEFLGVSRIPNELSFWFSWPNEDDLEQWVLCLVSADENNRAFVGSLRGIGTGPIPFV